MDGEGEYNLNVLKEIVVTDAFLGLDENSRECQNEEPFVCTTKKFVDAFLGKCGCLPLHMRLSEEVQFRFTKKIQIT